MTRYLYIVCALVLTACASQLPLDDAYYWPDKKAKVVQKAEPVTVEPIKAEPAKPAPTMEIISQQDTTITVRIKK